MSVMLLFIDASKDKLYPKDVIEELSDIEQFLSDKIEVVLKVDLQLTSQENGLDKDVSLGLKINWLRF